MRITNHGQGGRPGELENGPVYPDVVLEEVDQEGADYEGDVHPEFLGVPVPLKTHR